MNTNFAYDKKDYYSILEYLKTQAAYFSDGQWTDFSDGDIGTVLLKLMAMNSDTTNYQVEKGISELYLDTAVERSNIVALCKLIGYEPRHFMSAIADITITNDTNEEISLPSFVPFYNTSKDITYYNLEEKTLNVGNNKVEVYEGTHTHLTRTMQDINSNGTIVLDSYNIATNTFVIKHGGKIFTHIDNALYGDSEACYSIHLNSENQVYIQFPPYYKNFITDANIEIDYLSCVGEEGRVGAEILKGDILIQRNRLSYINLNSSIGGYNPETVEEIKKEAPLYSSTMDTLITLKDFKILAKDFEGISDVVALDYNYPESGLIQPSETGVNDAFKVNLYILPEQGDSIYEDDGETYNKEILEYIRQVNLKKPSSIQTKYYNVSYVKPHIFIKVYVEETDLRFADTPEIIKNHLVETYKRENRYIGQPLYKSNLSNEITTNFDYIKYLEVVYVEGEQNGALKVDNKTYIELLKDNITVEAVPYNE